MKFNNKKKSIKKSKEKKKQITILMYNVLWGGVQ
jgi:hypothetical protein